MAYKQSPCTLRLLFSAGFLVMFMTLLVYWKGIYNFVWPWAHSRHTHWMCEAKIVTVMGFVGLGDQRPKMESHEGQKFSLGPSYQRTAQIVQNIRSGDVIVILRNSLDHFMDLVESESTLAQDFVLVSVNTDDPVTAQHRDQVSKFAPIRAFFGQNMQIGLGNHKKNPLASWIALAHVLVPNHRDEWPNRSTG